MLLVLEFLQPPPVDLVQVLLTLGLKPGAGTRAFLVPPDAVNKLVLLDGVEKWNAFLFRPGLNERWFLLDTSFDGMKIQKSIAWEIIESGPLSQESFFDLSQTGVWLGLIDLESTGIAQANLYRHAPFYGRLTERELLSRYLELNRCVVVGGGPGIGKRALVQEVLSEIFQQGSRRVVTATFSGILPNLVAEISGQVDGLATSQIERLSEQIGDRDLILSLHHAENNVDAIQSFIEILISQCPNLTIVVTTRRMLAIPGAAQMILGGLSRPVVLDEVASSAAFDSVDLFLDRAQFIQPNFTIGVEDRAPFIELIEKLGGNPAGIEQAATLVDRFTLAEIAKFSDEALDRFGKFNSKSNLREGWRPAWKDADENQRFLLAAIGSLRGAFRISDLVYIVQDTLEEEEVYQAFNGLYEWCWFHPFESDQKDKFFQPDPIGMQIANEYIFQPEQNRALEKRLDEWALIIAQEGENGPIQILYGDIRYRMNLAAARGNLSLASEIAFSVFEYWYSMGFFVEGIQNADELLKRIGKKKLPFLDRLLLMNFYLHADYNADKNDEKLRKYARQALKFAFESGDKVRIATAMMAFSRLYKERNWAKAFRWGKRAYEGLDAETLLERKLYAANVTFEAAFYHSGYELAKKIFCALPKAIREDGLSGGNFAYLATIAGDNACAMDLLPAALLSCLETKDRTNTYRTAHTSALLFHHLGWHEQVVVSLSWRNAVVSQMEYVDREDIQAECSRLLESARANLSPEQFSEAWMVGQTMSFEEYLKCSYDAITSKK